jgi:ABC-type glutathione transport system ATPase component
MLSSHVTAVWSTVSLFLADMELAKLPEPAAAAAAPSLTELLSLSKGYAPLLHTTMALRKQSQQPLPTVSVSLQDVTYNVDIPVKDTVSSPFAPSATFASLTCGPCSRCSQGYETVGSKALDLVLFRKRTRKMQSFAMLRNVSVTFAAGTSTLILAPPGHGKSTLLKAVAARSKPTGGSVRFNGLSAAEATKSGAHIERLSQCTHLRFAVALVSPGLAARVT